MNKYTKFVAVIGAFIIILVPTVKIRAQSIVIGPDFTSANVIKMVNALRAAQGLLNLIENQKLDQAATLKAQDMVKKGYFAHNAPDGTSFLQWAFRAGYNGPLGIWYGENLARGFLNANNLITAWQNSSSHYANIIDTHYTDTGVAFAVGDYNGNSAIYAVETFGGWPPSPTVASSTATTTPR